ARAWWHVQGGREHGGDLVIGVVRGRPVATPPLRGPARIYCPHVPHTIAAAQQLAQREWRLAGARARARERIAGRELTDRAVRAVRQRHGGGGRLREPGPRGARSHRVPADVAA